MTRVVALSGGVGGAKLAAGLADVLSPGELLIAANTGDDFEHLGLMVCADLDSNLYALAGLNDEARGWGRRDETWNFMQSLAGIGGETWFRLGDRDLATHVQRTLRLCQGATLSQVTSELATALGITARLVPMSEDRVRTFIVTDEGRLPFQDYFVRRQCGPAVRVVEYEGAAFAAPQEELLGALRDPKLECILICPSNPWLSIGPMLAMPALRAALDARRVPLVAVSPIVGGRALRGPADKIMRELGMASDVLSVAEHYGGLVDCWLIDEADAAQQHAIAALGCTAHVTATVMHDAASRRALAQSVLRAAGLG